VGQTASRHLRRWGLACGLALIAACSGANAINTGPFSPGPSSGDRNALCTPVRPGGVLTYALDSYTNSSTSPATIERVALTDPHNLQILAAWAVPLTGTYGYGVLDGPPPARHLPADVHWAQRQRASGAVIPPKAHTILVLVLKPAGTKGTARSIDMYYRSAGQQYHLQTATSIEVLVAKACPS
jgi:hypothetical protein